VCVYVVMSVGVGVFVCVCVCACVFLSLSLFGVSFCIVLFSVFGMRWLRLVGSSKK